MTTTGGRGGRGRHARGRVDRAAPRLPSASRAVVRRAADSRNRRRSGCHAAGLEVRTGLARTGVVGVLRADKPGRTIAWRADIDALPVTELLEAPFTSGTAGVMHAAGTTATRPSPSRWPRFSRPGARSCRGTAVFIFQPAEELLGGAKPMIEAGAAREPARRRDLWAASDHADPRGGR